ncbi:MAG: metallophosphoesterase, partial [Gammaproteobacteria bacterium]
MTADAVVRLEHNEVGRDLIVGDIHGEFIALKDRLDELEFVPGRDRLFSVGDLIDRGPNSDV